MNLKVLSWNIWCGTYLEGVIDFLKHVDADIVALQEVSDDSRGNLAEIIAKKLGYEYVFDTQVDMPLKYLPGYESNDERTIKFGNAILSKHKIIHSEVHLLGENGKKSAVQARIEVGSNILNVFSVHLLHTHQQPSEAQNKQAENLLKFLPKENMMVMGDFNSLPESTVIKSMNETLYNTEPSSNTPTWSVYKEGCTECLVDEIKYKLDYIFTSKDLISNSFTVHESKASDHLPVSVIIEI